MKIILVFALAVILIHTQIDFPTAYEVPVTATTTTLRAPIISSLLYKSVDPIVTTGVDASGTPSASISAELSTTESAPIQTKAYYITGTYTSPYDAANNYWNAATILGQTCCGNCSRFCGVAFKITGTNRYVTNVNSIYLAFQASSNPGSNQIFTLNQNADCTWSIKNGNRYLSTSNSNGGNWISFSYNIGAP